MMQFSGVKDFSCFTPMFIKYLNATYAILAAQENKKCVSQRDFI